MPVGPADLIAWNPVTNYFMPIDVKTVRVGLDKEGSKKYSSSLNKAMVKRGVHYLGYCPEEHTFMWLSEESSDKNIH
jgi:hypothetical protein